jgi:hypothetical protein
LLSVERRADAVERTNQLYKEQPLPLHVVGSGFGQNAYVALMELAGRMLGLSAAKAHPMSAVEPSGRSRLRKPLWSI